MVVEHALQFIITTAATGIGVFLGILFESSRRKYSIKNILGELKAIENELGKADDKSYSLYPIPVWKSVLNDSHFLNSLLKRSYYNMLIKVYSEIEDLSNAEVIIAEKYYSNKDATESLKKIKGRREIVRENIQKLINGIENPVSKSRL